MINRYSFIIPVKRINDYIQEAISRILEIDRSDYEILVFPDKEDSLFNWEKTRQIATGSIGPAEKRDLALKHAKGQFLIFIDDDAYPQENFLEILDNSFRDDQTVAVGGPAITPVNDSFWQKVSGAVFLSRLAGGFPERYWPVGEKRFVDDWPSVNLTVKKEAFAMAGGFNSRFWPGEDTKLCLDLIEKVGGKILYNPDLIVWHHRRDGLIKHLKQTGRYGLHRGFFAKAFPHTSLKLRYFIPSLFVCFVIITPALVFIDLFKWMVITGWIFYLTALIKAFLDILYIEKNLSIALCSLYYIVPTHIFYGLRFIQGLLFTKELRSKLRKEI
jgi:glycosyltransferase involved in cell wall biosynthesis